MRNRTALSAITRGLDMATALLQGSSTAASGYIKPAEYKAKMKAIIDSM